MQNGTHFVSYLVFFYLTVMNIIPKMYRNSTLEFLGKLNAKHKWKFGELKNKVVVFPGGTDFMRILVELTKLAMRVILKRNNVDSQVINHM